MMKLIPDMNIMTKEGYGNLLPWNRAKRKRLLRAEKVVLHICSGPEHRFWEKHLNTDKVETLCIDLEGPVKADILNDAVFSYLIALAASGRLKAILAGPPCRTCSALRFKDDNGPGIIRTEEHPYGCPGISEKDFELVQNDSLIFLRTLALYVIAEEVRPHHEPQTGFGLEQPEDPANYRPEKEVKEVGFMSMWRTPEWKGFASKFNIKLISFDQGPMGHSKRKPTSMGVALPQAQQLHELRGPPSDRSGDVQLGNYDEMSLDDRCALSKSWAAWAPGLKAALVASVKCHLDLCGNTSPDHLDLDLRGPEQPKMKPLGPVALRQWQKHFVNDHYPARRDCRQCIQSQARGRPHKRLQHAEAFTLSLDLSGKMTPGHDQSGEPCKYLMVACYTYPVDGQGKSLIDLPGGEQPDDHPLPAPDDPEFGFAEDGCDAPLPPEEEDLLRKKLRGMRYRRRTRCVMNP